MPSLPATTSYLAPAAILQSASNLFKQLKSIPSICALLSVAVGTAVLAGWGLDVPLLRSVLPGAVEMKANTALGLVLKLLPMFDQRNLELIVLALPIHAGVWAGLRSPEPS